MREESESIVKVRRATADDRFSIAAVLYEAFAEHESSYTREAFAATILTPALIQDRMKEGPVWVAIKSEAIVGTVSVMMMDKRLYVRSMAVLPATRGGGVGHKLLECAEEFAIENGCESLFLSTTPFLARAIRLYEGYGFRPRHEGPDNLFGTPLVTMVKTLTRETRNKQEA